MPTRLDAILDLAFCNDYNCIFNPKTAEPFGTSDINQVRLEMPLATLQRERTWTVQNFKYADSAGIKDFLNSIDFYQYSALALLLCQISSFYYIIYSWV